MLGEPLGRPQRDVRGAVEAGRAPFRRQPYAQRALGIGLAFGVVELPYAVELVVAVEHATVVEAGQQRLAPAVHRRDLSPHQRVGLGGQFGEGEPHGLQPPAGKLLVQTVGGTANLRAFGHPFSLRSQ